MSPLKALHVCGALDYGGVEVWLLRLLRRVDRARLQIDVLTLFDRPGVYDAEARLLGSRVLPCPGYRHPWLFAQRFQRLVQTYGPYDIIHSHLKEYSGLVCYLARRAGIPVRIAHSHSDVRARRGEASPVQRLYRGALRGLLARHATVRLAVSEGAARSLFGEEPRPWRFLPCGVDLAPFALPVARETMRAELGLTPDALVVGHVGRLVEEKNHRLLIEVAAALAARRPESRLLLVGDGPLRPAVEAQIAGLGLEGRVTLLGARPDVAALLAAMDVFVLPSLHEGLPIAAVEAQAAGLPCLVSDAVSREVEVVPPLVRRAALAAPAEVWADAVLAAAGARPTVARAEALEQVRRSPLSLERGLAALTALYEAEAGRARRA